ncbi:hypothetical protein Adt_39713 [Abeliophyllum distichum]|uniref:Uncharacterized protein n=1 Tax=Abeliophyllum distichum TaxID=126358 RepID=A0ABD1Q6X2_9LAMI
MRVGLDQGVFGTLEGLNGKLAKEEANSKKLFEELKEGFGDTPEYQDLTHHFMTAGGEQLVERINEVHLEWDLSFLRHPPGEASTFPEPTVSGEVPTVSGTLGTAPSNEVGLQCADPSEAGGQ